MSEIPKAAVEAAASDIWRNVEWYAAASPENVAEEIIQAALPHLDGYAAVWMAEAGVSMDEIASYLGHSDPRLTYRVYAKFSPAYLAKAASALDL